MTSAIGHCRHCGIAQFDNPDADPALDAMAHLCWKCVRPWKNSDVIGIDTTPNTVRHSVSH